MEDTATETTTEPTTEATETAPASPLDTLDATIDEKISASEESTSDPLADYGVDAPQSSRSHTEPAQASTENTTDAGHIQEIENLKRQLADRDVRDAVTSSLGKIKESFPNAYEPSVQRAIRQGANADQIERIAKASHSDYERGKREAWAEAKVELAKVRDTATQTAEADVQQAWGTPASSTPIGGAGKMSYEELRTIANKPGVTPQELAEAEKQYFGG